LTQVGGAALSRRGLVRFRCPGAASVSALSRRGLVWNAGLLPHKCRT